MSGVEDVREGGPIRNKQARLLDWGYGVGIEGIRDAPGVGAELNVVIVDDSFPWWWMPMKSIAVNVIKVWLINEPSVALNYLMSSWCPGASIVVGSMTESLWEACKLADCIVFGTRIPLVLITRGLWQLPRLKVVVTAKQGSTSPPKPWSIQGIKIRHCEVGGVTDGHYVMWVATCGSSVPFPISLPDIGIIRQDLRWVMKSNEDGSRSPKPGCIASVEASDRVRFCGKNIIEQSSLLPSLRTDVLVRSEFRGRFWVDRRLTTKELLLTLDIPERLFLEVTDKVSIDKILQSIQTPIKVLQIMAVQLQSYINPTQYLGQGKGIKRKRSMGGTERKSKRCCMVVAAVDHNDVGVTPVVDISENFGENNLIVHNLKALKNDNAEVVEELWDRHFDRYRKAIYSDTEWKQVLVRVMNFWRSNLLRLWKRMVVRSAAKWKGSRILTGPEQEAIADCLRRSGDATWWGWEGGSRPFFWRWPEEYQIDMMSGVTPWFIKTVARWRRAQRDPGDPVRYALIRDKLDVIRRKNYIEPGYIKSIMPFFDVAKGSSDIRMVYDGSASGLNGCMWAPWFPLPTVMSLVRAVEPGTWMADNDVGEMFHNFMLHQSIREHCGLDLTKFYPNEVSSNRPKLWERWNRLAMGLRNSPFCAVQGMLIAKEVILGDRRDNRNVFRWETVKTNLPGSSGYNPSDPWFTKVRVDGTMAADLFIYVDDIRSTAPTEAEAWVAAQQTSSVLGYLGLQDAARKRRSPSQQAGAWTGSVVWSTDNQVSVLTTQDKWDKTKDHLEWIRSHMEDTQGLDHKKLQSIRGFLVYVSRTYGSMVPYLKGLHATIDSWRLGRNEDGWKQKHDPQLQWEFELDIGPPNDGLKEPKFVHPVPRLKKDLNCLLELTKTAAPPIHRIRMSQAAKVVYGFGDASKQGFGASIELPDRKIFWRYGQWRLDEEQRLESAPDGVNLIRERSSNFRELRNLVESLESAINKRLLEHCEIFMFTDNTTAEAAYNKGTSSSESLFELVLRLRKIEMSGTCKIHLIHVAGTRMIWQGTDGLSRGDQNAGVMAGDEMLSFVPLHKSVTDRSDKVVPWIQSWCEARGITELESRDWPLALREQTTYLWKPPPALADVAGEYMSSAIHKRPTTTHIFVCPRLMCSRWYKLILKATDVLFCIPIGCDVWSIDQHEPLILAISFPLSRTYPWRQGESANIQHTSKLVQSLLSGNFTQSGIVLRELIVHAWEMGSL